MTKEHLDYALIVFQALAAFVSALSAGAWGYASYLAKHQEPSGFDNDMAATNEAAKQANWNGNGAALAAIAAVLQAITTFIAAYAAANFSK